MNWAKECVIDLLKRNPYYESFTDEFEGKFCLHYVVSNIPIVICNEVGGFINGYFEGYYNSTDADIKSAREFLTIAVAHFKEKIQ